METQKTKKQKLNKACIFCGETERRVLTECRGKGIWTCWDCDNKQSQQETN